MPSDRDRSKADQMQRQQQQQQQMPVFISHSHRDKEIVRKLAHDLADHGVKAWLDEDMIAPGENWVEKINRAVDASDAVLVILSRNTEESRWQSSEIAFAVSAQRRQRGKKIIPVLVQRGADVPFFLRDRVYCDLADDDAYARNFPQLVAALARPLPTDQDITQADELRIDALHSERDLLDEKERELSRHKEIWSSMVLGAIGSVLAVSFGVVAALWPKVNGSLPFLKDASLFVAGVLAGIAGSFVSVAIAWAYRKAAKSRREADHG